MRHVLSRLIKFPNRQPIDFKLVRALIEFQYPDTKIFDAGRLSVIFEVCVYNGIVFRCSVLQQGELGCFDK